MESVERIQAKINELNKESARQSNGYTVVPTVVPQVWQAVNGYFVVTGFDYAQGKNIFNANVGYPLKIFVHLMTGEVKMFRANLFEI